MAIASTENRAALVYQNIEITRMDGVRDRFGIESFSPGINLVHGPNGIGKSRTAFALQALIWPQSSSNRAEIVGNLHVSESEWRVDLDAGRVQYQRDGVPGSTPAFASLPETHRDRYLLTLQDLLRVDNRDFASEIQREAAGGYDLAHVGDEMRTRSGRPSRAITDLQTAETEVTKLRRDDQHLRQEEMSLAGARKDLDGAIAAGERVRMLEAAQEHAEARERRREAQVARDAFEDPIGSMSGNEYEQVQALTKELQELELRRSNLEREIRQHTRSLEETGFADRSASSTVVAALRDRLAKLHRCEAEWQRARRAVETSSALLATQRARLGEHISDEQLRALDSEGLLRLSHLTRQYVEAEAAHQAQEALREWLGTTDASADIDQLRRGVDLLSRFLQVEHAQEPEHPHIVRWMMLGAAGLIVVQAVLLAIQATPGYLVLASLAAPVAWVALRRQTPVGTQSEHLREEYSRLGLEHPGDWTRPQVSETLTIVQKNVAYASLEHEKHLRWNDLATKRAQVEERFHALDAKRRDVLAALGVVPEHHDSESLRLIASALEGWRDAGDSLAQAEATVVSMNVEMSELLASINEALREHDAPQALDTSEASAAIEQLADRITRADRVRSARQHSSRLLENEVEPRIEALEEQVSGIHAALGIDVGDAQRLRDLCESVQPCRDAQRALEAAEVVVETSRSRLEDAPDYAALSREEIERRFMEAARDAARRDEIQERISTIEARIRQARQQTTLEQAIAAESAAVEVLGDARHQAYEAVVAGRVLAFIQDRNDERNRPAVFGVADEYFRRFTTGAYKLGITEGTTPEFLAIDTATGRSLELTELSSGTRVQLLLAVRLAFIESSEHGPQLPLILDETLGNTDDLRAIAIIDAAIEIARGGRQVIYFTAQRDEIAKWHARLDDQKDGPAWEVFDLALIRGDARAETSPALDWDREIFDVADIPEDVDYHQLHTLLNVPPVDMWAERADGVDLWYLIPDIEPLMTLRNRSVRTWGQYLALHKSQFLDGLESRTLHERAKTRAEIIEMVCREWRRGRPKSLTKQFLHTSDFITDTFRERVDECAKRHGWRGDALIQALRNGEVSRFQHANINGLEASFREHGYITDTEPVPQDLIRARAFSVAAGAIEQGVLESHEVDRLLLSMSGDLTMASRS